MTKRKELADKVGQMIAGDRAETHGNPHVQFATAGRLKHEILNGPPYDINWHPTHIEGIQQICTKLSRIKHGNRMEVDHWLDIAGYALICAEACYRDDRQSSSALDYSIEKLSEVAAGRGKGKMMKPKPEGS